MSVDRRIQAKSVNEVLQKILPIALTLVLFLTIIGAILNHQLRSPWTIGDWLINYQGGFVRRGLMGEAVLKVAQVAKVNVGVVVVVLQSTLYALFFFFVWRLLRLQTTLVPHFLMIASPFFFVFQLHDRGGATVKRYYFLL